MEPPSTGETRHRGALQESFRDSNPGRDGRVRFFCIQNVSNEHRRQIMALSGYGIPQVEIATLIACDTKTLLKAEPEPDDGGPVASPGPGKTDGCSLSGARHKAIRQA